MEPNFHIHNSIEKLILVAEKAGKNKKFVAAVKFNDKYMGAEYQSNGLFIYIGERIRLRICGVGFSVWRCV